MDQRLFPLALPWHRLKEKAANDDTLAVLKRESGKALPWRRLKGKAVDAVLTGLPG